MVRPGHGNIYNKKLHLLYGLVWKKAVKDNNLDELRLKKSTGKQVLKTFIPLIVVKLRQLARQSRINQGKHSPSA